MTPTRVIFQNEGNPGFCYVFDGKDFYWFEYDRPNKIDYDDRMQTWVSTTMNLIIWNDS